MNDTPEAATAVRAGRDTFGRARTPMPTVLYIVGIGRSGSTLLDRTLGAPPGFFAAGEMMHLFGRGWARNERCGCGQRVRSCPVWGRVVEGLSDLVEDPEAVDRLRHRVTEGRHLPGMFLPWRTESFEAGIRELRSTLATAYREVRRVTGARVVVDSSKNPGYGRLLTGIAGLPVYLVHLVRDSRGVARSLEKKRERPGTGNREEYLDRRSAATGSLFWSAAQLLAESLAGRADGYLRVRYRDFVHDPRSTVRRVLELAGEFEGAEQLSHVDGREVSLDAQHLLSGNPARSRTGSVTLREDVEWRRALDPSKKGVVTALTLPLLLRYGYLRDGSKRGD